MSSRTLLSIVTPCYNEEENVEELYALPEEFAGSGETYMLKVRGDSMIEAGILDGDFDEFRAQTLGRQSRA